MTTFPSSAEFAGVCDRIFRDIMLKRGRPYSEAHYAIFRALFEVVGDQLSGREQIRLAMGSGVGSAKTTSGAIVLMCALRELELPHGLLIAQSQVKTLEELRREALTVDPRLEPFLTVRH